MSSPADPQGSERTDVMVRAEEEYLTSLASLGILGEEERQIETASTPQTPVKTAEYDNGLGADEYDDEDMKLLDDDLFSDESVNDVESFEDDRNEMSASSSNIEYFAKNAKLRNL